MAEYDPKEVLVPVTPTTSIGAHLKCVSGWGNLKEGEIYILKGLYDTAVFGLVIDVLDVRTGIKISKFYATRFMEIKEED